MAVVLLGWTLAVPLPTEASRHGGQRSKKHERRDDAHRQDPRSEPGRARQSQDHPSRPAPSRDGRATAGQNQLHREESVRLRSEIGRSPKLRAYARAIDGRIQQEIDSLSARLAAGHMSPGKGTKALKGLRGIYELRGQNGGRVYYRLEGGQAIIVAKSTKGTQNKVIAILSQMYGD